MKESIEALQEDRIQFNKDRFIELLSSIQRENCRIDELINYLNTTDFFTAPASSKFHSAYKGGLCEHTLNVYDSLCDLITMSYNDDNPCPYNEDSIKIVSLLHDMGKIDYYEQSIVNKKVYHDDGMKQDNLGKFDWVSESMYKVKDANKRFLFGNHEQTCEYIARCFIPLTVEESVAILHHMGGMGIDSAKDELTAIYNEYSLAALLHLADVYSTYIKERIVDE